MNVGNEVTRERNVAPNSINQQTTINQQNTAENIDGGAPDNTQNRQSNGKNKSQSQNHKKLNVMYTCEGWTSAVK